MFFPVAALAVLFFVQLLYALSANDGTVVLSLDDPYIVLDLADQLWRTGVYGVNPGIMCSPASSIVWPFFLVPLVLTPWPVEGLLALGIFFVLVSVFLIARLGKMLFRFDYGGWKNGLFVLINVLALQLPTLAWGGLEHSLQVAVTLGILVGLFRVLDGATEEERRPAWWLWLLIGFAPLVRYECVLVSASALGILLWKGRWRGAVVTAGASGLVLGAFSFFLLSHGLHPLPDSVVVKKLNSLADPWGDLLLRLGSLGDGLNAFGLYLIALGGMWGLVALARLRQFRSVEWAVAASLFISPVLFIVFGDVSTNSPNRYIIFLIVWVLFFTYRAFLFDPVFLSLKRWVRGMAIMALVPLPLVGIGPTFANVVTMSHCIYTQQYQMARLAQDFLKAPVFANDVGLLGFHNPHEVIDLIGLTSPEVLRARLQEQQTFTSYSSIIEAKDAELAMVYGHWFPSLRVAPVYPVGMMVCNGCVNADGIGGIMVMFYAKSREDALRLKPVIDRWVATLPDRTLFVYEPALRDAVVQN